MRAKAKNTCLKVCILVTTLVTALVIAEVALRVVSLFPPDGPVYPDEHVGDTHDQADAKIGWKMPPSTTSTEETEDFSATYTSNEQGFRDVDNFDPENDPPQRIVFLGDSMTFGVGVEDDEVFVEQIEKALGGNTRCYNLAMSGFGVAQMLATLRAYAYDLQPDLVVVPFIIDDLNRSLSAFRFRGVWMQKPAFAIEGDKLVPLTAENSPPKFLRWISRTHLGELRRRVGNRVTRTYPIGYRWKLNRKLFQTIHDECRAAGVPILFVHLLAAQDSKPAPVFAKEFQDMGIPFLDLQDSIRAGIPGLHFEHDWHFTAAGHAHIARELLDYISEHQLLSDEDRSIAP